MFTFEESNFKEITDNMKDDIGEDLVERLRNEVIKIKSQYGENIANEIKYFSDDKIVGSTTFGPNIINEGTIPGTFPNFDRIVEWVRTVKDGGKWDNFPETMIKQIAYRVSKKIEREGIDPTWFVDRALSKLEGENL